MKQTAIILLFVLCAIAGCAAQTVEDVVRQAEQNSSLLSAWKEQYEADRIGNRTGILPENPEVEYHYLWGSPATTGNRQDFSATQRFDFPTAYRYRRKVADGKDRQADLRYRSARGALLLEVRRQAIAWIYYRDMLNAYASRLADVQEIAEAYRAGADRGDVSLPEYNRAKINLLNVQKEINLLEMAQRQTCAEMVRLNGGKDVSLPGGYSPAPLPPDFEQWYAGAQAGNVSILYLQQAAAVDREQVKLQRSLNLPEISVGYMSERVLTEQFRGIVVGVSVPLWEGRNTVRRARAQAVASRTLEEDAQMRARNEAKALYEKAKSLLEVLTAYKKELRAANSMALLKKALDAGEISLIEYIAESGIYYETADYVRNTERDYQLAMAELCMWEL
ncbi:MAG: TolC family protein [Tannerella sp.]|jgi:outer membrane protein TolC|nr:TolC family protein [Tannerella sp.]